VDSVLSLNNQIVQIMKIRRCADYRKIVSGAIGFSLTSPQIVPFAPVCETEMIFVKMAAGWYFSTLPWTVISCVVSFCMEDHLS